MKHSVLIAVKNDSIASSICKMLSDCKVKISPMLSSDETISVSPDFIFTDMTNLSVVEALREWLDVPIIAISENNFDENITRAFKSGVDDFMCYPFSKAELIARFENAIRHTRTVFADDRFVCANLSVDFVKKCVMVDGQAVGLTPTEYKILEILIRNSGALLSHEYIMNRVWGPYTAENNKILRVNITNIRKKLGDKAKDYIVTEKGVGYKFCDE